MTFFAGTLLAALAVTASVAAQPTPAPGSELAELARCRSISSDTERLACFDAASASLQRAVDTRQISVINREGMKRTKRSLFGFNLPDVNLFGGKEGDEPPSFQEIETTLARSVPQRNGFYLLVLADGARWRTTEPVRSEPSAGDQVRIRKGTLGSYIVSIRNGRGVRAVRVG